MTIAGSSGHFELNVFKPMIIANFIQSAQLLGDGALSFTENCLEGLAPDHEQIKTHLENSLMLVTALNPVIGYDKAARIAKHAHEKNLTLKEAAHDLGILDREGFDTLVNPGQMTGHNQ